MRIPSSTALFLPASLALLAAVPAMSEGRHERESRMLKHLSLEELMEVEVRAPTKADLPIREAPTVGTVITREEIEAYGWQTLADVLLRQPGFSPSQDYERVTISGRGQYENWNNNHIRILIDGVPANSVSKGVAFVWEMMPLSMVETIEIIRGPGSALYGSNALNGVVAINTRKAVDMPPAEMSLRGGNAGTHWTDIAGSNIAPWLSSVAGYGYRETRGNVYSSYDASGRVSPGGGLRAFELNDQRSSHSAYLKLEGDGPLKGLSMLANLAWWKFQTGHGWLYRVPDERERATNTEGMAWLQYRPPPLLDGRLNLEFVVEWLYHAVDYRIRDFPDSAIIRGAVYPDGVTELAQLSVQDIFLRGQADYRMFGDIRAMVGVEHTLQPSQQESGHEANIDLNRGGTFQPFPDGGFRTMKPIYEAMEGQPFENSGVFLQLESGRTLTRFVSAIAGVRYDYLSYGYIDLDDPARPTRERSLEQYSPRVALVVLPLPTLSLKALGERSFRTPAPSELYPRNSLLGNSRPDRLQAEEMSAFTLAGDLTLFRHMNLRADWFIQDFDNQIAFSGSENMLGNIYSRRVTGVETEIRSSLPLGEEATLDGFLNHTWIHQLDEEILDATLAPSDRLTWGPSQFANGGLSFRKGRWEASAQGHWQGRVHRRRSDRFQADGAPTAFSAYRSPWVEYWTTLDALVSCRVTQGLRVRAQGTNLLDEEGYLVKPRNYPFDFRIEGMRLSAAAELSL